MTQAAFSADVSDLPLTGVGYLGLDVGLDAGLDAGLEPALEPALETGLKQSLMDSHLWASRPEALKALLQQAFVFTPLLNSPQKSLSLLAGRTVATLFVEDSTRTRSSFELAAKYLGAHFLNLQASTSSLNKGETLEDTVETLMAMGVEAIIIRHSQNGVLGPLVERFGHEAAFLNAGDGNNDHPTQALLDLYTLLNHWQAFDAAGLPDLTVLKGKKLVIVGDINHSRVARANLRLLKPLGVQLHVAGPKFLVDAHLPELQGELKGVEVHRTLEKALAGADAVMALRMQKERMQPGTNATLEAQLTGYCQNFQLNHAVLERFAPAHAVILHPGPVNRGVELSPELMDDPVRSLIRQQVSNGVLVRMASLCWCLGLC